MYVFILSVSFQWESEVDFFIDIISQLPKRMFMEESWEFDKNYIPSAIRIFIYLFLLFIFIY